MRKKHKNNKSGYTGVSWNQKRKKWIAFINQYGKRVYLGAFDCPKEAYQEYLKENERWRE